MSSLIFLLFLIGAMAIWTGSSIGVSNISPSTEVPPPTSFKKVTSAPHLCKPHLSIPARLPCERLHHQGPPSHLPAGRQCQTLWPTQSREKKSCFHPQWVRRRTREWLGGLWRRGPCRCSNLAGPHEQLRRNWELLLSGEEGYLRENGGNISMGYLHFPSFLSQETQKFSRISKFCDCVKHHQLLLAALLHNQVDSSRRVINL